MKVLHITNAYPYEGHPEYGCFIYEQINSLDNDVVSDICFINAHKLGALEYFKSIPKIRSMAKDSDLIHCHHLFSFIVLKLSFTKRKPVVLSFLNDWTKEIKLNIPEKLKHFLCYFYSMKPEKVIFKSFIPDFLNGDRYLFLPNGVDMSYFDIQDRNLNKEKLGLCKKSNYILFVSSKNLYRHQKRYDIFLKVMEYLSSNFPEMNYLPLTMSIDDRETARSKINSSSLHLLCSDYEGSPNSVKEALSSGIPVVSRPAGSVEDLLKGTPFTSLVDSDNHIEIANEIHKILSLQINRLAIREGLLNKKLSQEQVSGQLHLTYSNLISAKH